jgi:hypothetical protein
MNYLLFYTILTITNTACIVIMFRQKEYKASCFSSFAAGVSFMGILTSITRML